MLGRLTTRIRARTIAYLALFLAVGGTSVAAAGNVGGGPPSSDGVSMIRPSAPSGSSLPSAALHGDSALPFADNAGQADPSVRYLAQIPGAGIFFARDNVALALDRSRGEHSKDLSLRLRFLNHRPEMRLLARRPLDAKVNYLTGDDPDRWQTDVPTYGEIVYANVWPGIDVAFRGDSGQLKYEFRLRPGARPEATAGTPRPAARARGGSRACTAATSTTGPGAARPGPAGPLRAQPRRS